MNFVIGGLPRSGTAWLATMLNLHEGVLCFHDALQTVDARYVDAADTVTGFRYVGDASSAACLKQWPKKTVTLFVTRCIDRVRDSMAKHGFSDLMPQIEEWTCDWAKTADYHIAFVDIFSGGESERLAICEQIVNLCCPGVKFQAEKVKVILPLNIRLDVFEPGIYNPQIISERLK